MAPDSLLIHCPSLLHVIVHSLIAESCFPRASFQHRPRGLCAISLYPSLCLHGDLSPRIRPLWQQLSIRQLRATPMMRCDSKCIFSSSARQLQSVSSHTSEDASVIRGNTKPGCRSLIISWNEAAHIYTYIIPNLSYVKSIQSIPIIQNRYVEQMQMTISDTESVH